MLPATICPRSYRPGSPQLPPPRPQLCRHPAATPSAVVMPLHDIPIELLNDPRALARLAVTSCSWRALITQHCHRGFDRLLGDHLKRLQVELGYPADDDEEARGAHCRAVGWMFRKHKIELLRSLAFGMRPCEVLDTGMDLINQEIEFTLRRVNPKHHNGGFLLAEMASACSQRNEWNEVSNGMRLSVYATQCMMLVLRGWTTQCGSSSERWRAVLSLRYIVSTLKRSLNGDPVDGVENNALSEILDRIESAEEKAWLLVQYVARPGEKDGHTGSWLYVSVEQCRSLGELAAHHLKGAVAWVALEVIVFVSEANALREALGEADSDSEEEGDPASVEAGGWLAFVSAWAATVDLVMAQWSEGDGLIFLLVITGRRASEGAECFGFDSHLGLHRVLTPLASSFRALIAASAEPTQARQSYADLLAPWSREVAIMSLLCE